MNSSSQKSCFGSYNPKRDSEEVVCENAWQIIRVLSVGSFQVVKDVLEKRYWKTMTGLFEKNRFWHSVQLQRFLWAFETTLVESDQPISLSNCKTPINPSERFHVGRFQGFRTLLWSIILAITRTNYSSQVSQRFLKRIMDTEPMVQEAACSAFSNMISTKKEKTWAVFERNLPSFSQYFR